MSDDVTTCPICSGTFRDPVMPPCQHSFCFKCISDYMDQHSKRSRCPLCGTEFSKDELRKNLVLNRLLDGKSPTSSKSVTNDRGLPRDYDFRGSSGSVGTIVTRNTNEALGPSIIAGGFGLILGAIGTAFALNSRSRR